MVVAYLETMKAQGPNFLRIPLSPSFLPACHLAPSSHLLLPTFSQEPEGEISSKALYLMALVFSSCSVLVLLGSTVCLLTSAWIIYIISLRRYVYFLSACNYVDSFQHYETQAVFDLHSFRLFYFTVGPRRSVSILLQYPLTVVG